MTDQDKKQITSRSRRLLYGACAAAALAVGGYVVATGADGAGACPASEMTAALKPLAQGELAAFSVNATPMRLPPLTFITSDGRSTTLDAFKGKTVLLNLWATWCVPCRREMPALNSLQAELGGKDFEVVAVSVDTGGPDKPKKWLADNNIGNLAFYGDVDGNVLKTLQKTGQVVGLPTTILIDPQGCQRGIVRGPAEWASADALRLLRAALGRKE